MPRLVRFGLDRKRCLAAPGLTLCLSPQQRLAGTKQICQPYSLGGRQLRTSLGLDAGEFYGTSHYGITIGLTKQWLLAGIYEHVDICHRKLKVKFSHCE